MRFLISLFSLSLGFALQAATAASQPNIILFLADDLGWADVPWHGGQAKMPNLDRLGREGVKLEAHYGHPMCSPTRAALMTGRYASRFGVTGAQNQRALPWGTITLASTLKSAGYDTAITGKWHLGSMPDEGPQKFGFDHGYGSLAGGCGPFNHRYKEGPFTRTWHRNARLIEEEGHVTDLIAREAVRWIAERGERPFFLYVPFTAIHVPIDEPKKWHDMNAHLADPAQRLRAACASHLDDAIGQIIAAVQRKKSAVPALVIFLSDNGAHSPHENQGGPYPGDYGELKVGNDNRPLRGHKSSLYDGGIRTPGLVWWPGKIKAGEVKAPMHAVDWLPTLAALAGAKLSASLRLDGQNIWPAITGELPEPAARSIYCAGVGFRSQMIRHGGWKLIVNHPKDKKGQPAKPTGETEELYNLAEDIGETKNLAKEKPRILAEMKQRLAEIEMRDRDAEVKKQPDF